MRWLCACGISYRSRYKAKKEPLPVRAGVWRPEPLRARRRRSVCPDVDVLGFFDEQHADTERHGGHAVGVPENVIDIAPRCHDGERGRRQEAAEPAVADV